MSASLDGWDPFAGVIVPADGGPPIAETSCPGRLQTSPLPGQDPELHWACLVSDGPIRQGDVELTWDDDQERSARAILRDRDLTLQQAQAVLARQRMLGPLAPGARPGTSVRRLTIGGWNVRDFLAGRLDHVNHEGRSKGDPPHGLTGPLFKPEPPPVTEAQAVANARRCLDAVRAMRAGDVTPDEAADRVLGGAA